MPGQLPPFSALRTFLVVARHLNFSRAAAELNVTPAAVTHQIKALEAHVGVELLSRTKRRVLLTQAGEACLPQLREGFDLLHAAMARVRLEKRRTTLTVSVAPAFASKWLMPRLERFTAEHPTIDVRVSATTSLVDLADGNTDLAIRYGRGNVDGVHVELLLRESMAPMCAPELLKGEHGIRTPDDLRHHQLIHDVSVTTSPDGPSWKTWFGLAGVSGANSSRGLRCTLADLALQAAINRAGVVLGRVTLARDDLDARRLVMPFRLAIPADYSYFLLIANPKLRQEPIARFRDWLLEEASRSAVLGKRQRTTLGLASRARDVAAAPKGRARTR
jgi:LysR family glycine cleavage system transcriptional activator